ncbi:MAG: DUF3482 domain-containing protein [Rhodospirillales bacterium]|nr:DUF3482 domain-containing protein [Rhodospirillales bacterium]
MKTKPLAIVVVGHTNAGKTSLLRTLTRDKYFGEVSRRNATTKHVEQTSVVIAGKAVLKLFDTPGFEDSIEFRHYLRQFDDGRGRKEMLESFLHSPEAGGRFEQQAKVVRILLTKIDAIFYVIDSTEVPLPKYVSELEVLSMCAIPVLPVLNFIQTEGSHVDNWVSVLADRGLHIKVGFDAMAPLIGSERLLYTRLGNLLDGHDKQLLDIADAIEREARGRRESALQAIAELLIDVSALRALVPHDDLNEIKMVTERMHSLVKAAEQTCVSALLAIHCFDRSDLIEFDLPVIGTKPDDDLFNPEVIKAASVRLGLGAAIGAAIGLGVDIALVGVTMGAGAIVGGAVGGMLVGSAKNLWTWAEAKIRGLVDLAIDQPTLSVLLTRQLQLLAALNSRSHAAQQPLQQDGKAPADEHWVGLADPINCARAHPEWSRLGGGFVPSEDREKAIGQIQSLLL